MGALNHESRQSTVSSRKSISRSTTGSESSRKSTCKSKPRMAYKDLPMEVQDMVADMTITLSNHLDRIIASNRLRATNVIPIGKDILDLSSICCLVHDMLSGVLPGAKLSADDLDVHVAESMRRNNCPCSSVMDLLDLRGDVLHSFPDDGDDAPVPVEIQQAALDVIKREVDRAMESTWLLLNEGEDQSVPELKRRDSLESMVVQLSQGLKGLFAKSRRRSRKDKKQKTGNEKAGRGK